MISYKNNISSSCNDEFSQIFKESANYFEQKEEVSVLGEGFRDIITDEKLFGTYVDKILEGINDATEVDNLKTLLENARTDILTESSVGGIPPIASLAMPTIRKMWARISLKYAVPTQPVKTPAFQISFSLPYIIDSATSEKHYLPESLRDNENGLADKKKLSTEFYDLPLINHDLLSDAGAPASAGNSIDNQFYISSVKITCKDTTGANPEVKTVSIKSKVDFNEKLYCEVSAKHTDGTVTQDVVLGKIDFDKGTISMTSLTGAVTSVSFLGYVSSESHNNATNVSFDIKRRDITIGTGEHIEASLPLEMLTDTQAMYNVDGANEVVDVMSNITAQKVDQLIFNFLKTSQEANATYTGTFDVHPQGRFAGNPKDWLQELRRVIDYYATKIKTETYYYSGYFVIIGSPLDTMLIPEVNWTFNHIADTQNGVEVDYSIGAMSGANKYNIVSSDLIHQGSLYMFFVPLTDKFLTYKYFPYSFNVVHNYLNTKNPNVPSIMMTKRQTIEEFIPLICRIDILNNDGTITEPANIEVTNTVQTHSVT